MKEIQVKMLSIIQSCLEEQCKASLILDINGLEKVQGLVTAIEEENDKVIIHLDHDFTFTLDQVIAINGYFDPLYSMC